MNAPCTECDCGGTRLLPVAQSRPLFNGVVWLTDAPATELNVFSTESFGLLRDSVVAAGLRVDQMDVCPLIPCVPPNGKCTDSFLSKAKCVDLLWKHLARNQPRVVITLGWKATRWVATHTNCPETATVTKMSQVHGKAFVTHTVLGPWTWFPIFHPKAVVENRVPIGVHAYRTLFLFIGKVLRDNGLPLEL